MLKTMNKYEMYELAELALIAMLHDIGAYETDRDTEILQYETKEFMPHSIYGYLFLLYIMPFKDKARILLYHHTDYSKIQSLDYEYKMVIEFLNLAEKVDIYHNLLGSRFDSSLFAKHDGTRYSHRALTAFYQVLKKEDIIRKIESEEYLKELDELFSYLIFTNEEKKDSIDGLMYCVGFRSEYTMLDVVTCDNICQLLAKKLSLSMEEEEKLHYAAVLHDAGMCAVSRDIIEAPRRLSDEEMTEMRHHVEIAEKILRGRFDDEVVDIIAAHHERGNGSGYPRGLREDQMSRMQKILQVADMITALTSTRSYREPKPKQQVIEILKSESSTGKLSSEVVRKFITSYDEIMDEVAVKNAQMMSTYNRLKENYKTTYEQNK